MDDFEHLFVFHRLFVFPFRSEVEENVKKVRLSISSLVLHFSSQSVSVHAYWVRGDIEKSDGQHPSAVVEPIIEQASGADVKYDKVFSEKYKWQWKMAASDPNIDPQNLKDIDIEMGNPFLGRFYFSTLNARTNADSTQSAKSSSSLSDLLGVWPRSGRIYKGLSREYQPIGTKSLPKLKDGDDSNILKIDIAPTPNTSVTSTEPISLYTYHSTELKIVLVYGTDHVRANLRTLMTPYCYKVTQVIWSTWTLATVVLCIIRRKLRLRRNGFISSYIDMMICFFGGGTLRITHRIERWFFIFMSMAAFFIIAIYGATVFYSAWALPIKDHKSLDDIKTMNLPIFLSPTMEQNEESIKAILSQKIGRNNRDVGIKPFMELLNDHKKAFAYVTEETSVTVLKAMAKGTRDLTLLEESLGPVNSRYFLASRHHVPGRMMESIRQRTNWMNAGGIYQFYDSLGSHVAKLRERSSFEDKNSEDDVCPVSIGTLKPILAVNFVYIAIAFILLLIEFRNKKRQNQREMDRPRRHSQPHPDPYLHPFVVGHRRHSI